MQFWIQFDFMMDKEFKILLQRLFALNLINLKKIFSLDKLPKNPKNYVPRNIVSQTGTFTLLRLSNNPTFATAFFRLRNGL